MKKFLSISLLLLIAAGCFINLPPKPVDPNPNPNPNPNPFEPVVVVPAPGQIRVLILEETEDIARPEMRPWIGVSNSSKIRKYLSSHCKPDETTEGWLWVDPDINTEFMSDYWKSAITKTKADPNYKLPWIAITNGDKGISGPLSSSEDEVMALLKKWGGD